MNNLSMALKNLKKNFSFYALYLLSVSFVITVFFAFTSFSMNTIMLEKISGNGRVEMMCNVISVFLMAFVVFYMSYSNRFFLRRRTKELGVYALLGYRKTTVLSLLTTENLLVCFGAFIVGILLGSFFHKGIVFGITLDNMNTYIREQMQDYHPTLLPKLTIKENYQNLLDGISQSFPNRNVCVSFDCSDSLFLVEPYNIFVYRLLKELVTNVYKHSTGEKAWITLTQDNGIIILSVSDNGTVDADVLSSADRLKHRGLAMITERVNDMDGSVTISNNHPHGICVQTILPMKGDVSYQHFVSR